MTCRISGFADLTLSHLVLDYNGTLALDGSPLEDVREAVDALADSLQIHVVTADTFGRAAEALEGWPVYLSILESGEEAQQKELYVQSLGAEEVVAVGNGRNDGRMLSVAALGIGVLGPEGAASTTLLSADVVTRDIQSALSLLCHTDRLRATLRC